VRGFAFGLVVLVGLSLAVLSIRPGGLRRQLHLAARRFRIVLVLAGIWMLGSLVIRIAFSSGPVLDYGPALLGVLLVVAFLFVARDPTTPID
jgi:hypothetical protein